MSNLDWGLLDPTLLPKFCLASDFIRAMNDGKRNTSAVKQFYRWLGFNSIVPPQKECGGKYMWNREIFMAWVNDDIEKSDDDTYWQWRDTKEPVPVAPQFRPINRVNQAA